MGRNFEVKFNKYAGMSQIVNPDPYPCQSKIKPISTNLPQFPKHSLPLDGGGLGWGCNLLLLDNFLFTLPPPPPVKGGGEYGAEVW